MRTFAYADIGESFTIGVNLESWALPLYVTSTSDYCYLSIELYLLCLYFKFSWSPSDNGKDYQS